MSGTNGYSRASNIATVAVSVMAMGAAIWGLAIAPQQQEINNQQREIAALSDQLRSLQATLPETLREIETQFKAVSMLRNVQIESQDRDLSLLWEKVYGQQRQSLNYWPIVGEHR